nr:hypothetical protein [Pseudomonadota bacterium]
TTTHAGNGGGVLQGLIGAQGAVGAFISNVGATKAYGGGFVAKIAPPDPCIAMNNCPANYAAWTRSFDTGGVNADQTLQKPNFTNAIARTSTYIKLTDDNKIKIMNGENVERTLDPSILRLNDTVDADGYESGVAYVNINGSGFVGQSYAAMLPTTNLGAPLVDGSKDGTWTGSLKGATGFTEPPLAAATFSMKVTWNGDSNEAGSAGTIKSLDVNGDVGFAPVSGINRGMRFRGDFNAAGVMWGSINYGDVAADSGHFSGLIGAKGAVGVFRGVSASSVSFSGGFVLNPPAPSP